MFKRIILVTVFILICIAIGSTDAESSDYTPPKDENYEMCITDIEMDKIRSGFKRQRVERILDGVGVWPDNRLQSAYVYCGFTYEEKIAVITFYKGRLSVKREMYQ